MLAIINQVFEIKNKINNLAEPALFERNLNRLYAIFEEEGYIIHDPTNEAYEATRTDCEASIVGSAAGKMKITKTLKPIIYQKLQGNVQLQQKAIVIVEKL
ncbi:MAG: hypothetical protein ACKVOM_13055 [Ferruginibacter sp.]